MAGENLNPESDSEDDGKPNDNETEGLKAALTAERRKRQEAEVREAASRGRAEALAQTRPKDDARPVLSAADLRVAVDEGRMTEDEAEQIRSRQSEQRITSTVTANLSEALTSQKVSERADTEIGRYKTAVPEITDRDSVQFTKLQAEFDNLVSYGHDSKDPRTEALAARAAFGPVETLEGVGKAKPRETYGETGGGAEPDDGGGDKDGWPKDMSAGHRRYYDDQINQGVLVDRKAAIAEFNYKPKNRPRHAAA